MTDNCEEFKFKQLTDDDVFEMVKKTLHVDPKKLNEIYQQYVNNLNSMLVMAKKQTDDETEIVEIERLKRFINMLPIDEVFMRGKDKVWNVRNHILNRNANFFLERDYSKVIKKDKNQVMMETLVEIIKDKYSHVSNEEMEYYWKKGAYALNCIIRFKQLVGEDC